MLTVADLINIQYIPEITEVSLSLMVDFYEQYLCQRIFIFELADGQKVKLFFKDTSEIFHVSGIDHIYENMPMDGTHFIDGIKNKSIDFVSLESLNRAAYNDYVDRIRSLACIDTILKNCEYLWFSDGKIPESTIKVKYLLLKGLDDKNLHLGIDTYKVGKPYFSKTLLVTEGNAATKYIDKAKERLRVVSLEIINKNNGEVLEKVDRVSAIKKADKIIDELSKKWFEETFTLLIKEYKDVYADVKPNSRKKKEWVSKLSRYLENNQEYIRNEVKVFDPYWTSKIVAEQIRLFAKKKAMCLINDNLAV